MMKLVGTRYEADGQWWTVEEASGDTYLARSDADEYGDTETVWDYSQHLIDFLQR